MNNACDTVVHCVSIESKICIPRKACSQSEYRTHSLMFFGRRAMYVLRMLLTENTFHWNTDEKLNCQ